MLVLTGMLAWGLRAVGQVGVPSAYIIDHSRSPHAALRPLPFDAVQWTGGFWAERHQQLVDVTLGESWRLLSDPAQGHVLDNFRAAARPGSGEFAGTWWQDEWLYKWIEAAVCVLGVRGGCGRGPRPRDPVLLQRMDEGIALIAAAQQPDGYISTNITARGRTRFADANEHEVYNMGHLLTAGVIHHRMTGQDNLLRVATRTADLLCASLGTTVKPYFAHNPSAIMGLVEFYRLTGEKKYLDCAQLIVDARGTEPKRNRHWAIAPGFGGTDFIQDRVPVRQSTEIVGHNVFFTYLYTGAGDLLAERSDAKLSAALDRLWTDLTQRRMFINGGVSAIPAGMSNGAPVIEAAGAPYQLPNAGCYNETCGQVGAFMWGYRQLVEHPDAQFADVMEREMFNGFLPSMSLDGRAWFYRAILRRYDVNHLPSGRTDLVERVQPGREHVCCPSNLLRTLAQLSAYFYSADDTGYWVHQYGGSKVDTKLVSGEPFAFEQVTSYPWSGEIRIVVRAAPARPVAFHLRVPGWAERATFAVNDVETAPQVAHGYATVSRTWKPGDTLTLSLPLRAQLVTADARVEETRNQFAVMRGPLLYCAESPDLAAGVDLQSVFIASTATFEPVAGITGSQTPLARSSMTLRGQGLQRAEGRGDGLYRPANRAALQPFELKLIPYYAWANRGPSAMSVWIPAVWSGVPANN